MNLNFLDGLLDITSSTLLRNRGLGSLQFR